jgi:hypothetical protein
MVGLGLVIGALLALLNGILLERRIELAASVKDVGTALVVMQVGLLVTCTLVGLTTVVLIHFSLSMAIADAAGFAITFLGLLGSLALFQTKSQSDSKGDLS